MSKGDNKFQKQIWVFWDLRFLQSETSSFRKRKKKNLCSVNFTKTGGQVNTSSGIPSSPTPREISQLQGKYTLRGRLPGCKMPFWLPVTTFQSFQTLCLSVSIMKY